jgi:parallel beta-helix repeat protein
MRRFALLLLTALLAPSGIAGTLRVGSGDGAYRSISEAIKDLQPGDELVIGAGTYRETVRLPERDWSAAATVIRGERTGAVILKGSDLVTGWEPVSGSAGVFVKRGWAANSQQVFVDGEPLQQIGGTIMNGYPERSDHPMRKLHESQGGIWPGRVAGGRERLVDNSFFYDEPQKALYIKLRQGSLAGRQIEVSVRPQIIFGKGVRRITLRDLDLQHSNTTSVNYSGALTLLGDDLRLERINVSRTDGNGIDLTGDRILVSAVTANFCGQVGLKVRGRGNRIADSVTNYNNTRGFNKWWEAGGAKFVGEGGLKDSEVVNHRAIGNQGDGIWFDWLNDNNRVHGSTVAYNTGFGIHYEASSRARVYDNYVFGNGQRGIYLPNSPSSVVSHNLVVGNGLEGIAFVNERQPNRPEITARAARVYGNVIGWNARAAVILPSGTDGNASDYNVYFHDSEPPGFSLGWASRGSPLRRGLDDWKAASAQDSNSRSEHLALPPQLRKALDAREPAPDWTPLLSAADRLGVRVEGVAAGPQAR